MTSERVSDGLEGASVDADPAVEHSPFTSVQMQAVVASTHAAVNRLAAGMAHEVHTPIQTVASNLSFVADVFDDMMRCLQQIQAALAEGDDGNATCRLRAAVAALDLPYLKLELPQALRQSRAELSRVVALVGALKELAPPGDGQRQRADLHELLANALLVSRSRWQPVADVTTQFAAIDAKIVCAPAELGRAFFNVIENAAEAIAAKNAHLPSTKGRIVVSTCPLDRMVEVSISDTGQGMTAESRARAFYPFFSTKPVREGVGLGLAMARSIVVDRHGGSVHIASEPGLGCTFTARIPV